MDKHDLLANCNYQIKRTIEEFGAPSGLRFELANLYAELIAKNTSVDLEMVKIGLTFIDLGIWRSIRDKKVISDATIEYVNEILNSMLIEQNLKDKLMMDLKAYYDDSYSKSTEAIIISDALNCSYIHPSYILLSLSKHLRLGKTYIEALNLIKSKIDTAYNSIILKSTKDLILSTYNEILKNIDLCIINFNIKE